MKNVLENNCEHCHTEKTSQVINTETNTRHGWLCEECAKFTKAVGRERVWKPAVSGREK